MSAGEAIGEGLADTLSRPKKLVRMMARQVLEGRDPRLAGAIPGAELAVTRPWWLGQRVVALSSVTAPDRAPICARVLLAQGVPVSLGDGETALIAALAKYRGDGAS